MWSRRSCSKEVDSVRGEEAEAEEEGEEALAEASAEVQVQAQEVQVDSVATKEYKARSGDSLATSWADSRLPPRHPTRCRSS